MEVNNFCLNKTYKDFCQHSCGITCIDLITGQDRLFCDSQWGTSHDALFLGTGSPKYVPLYVQELDPHLVKVRNGSFVILGSVKYPPYTTPSENVTDLSYTTPSESITDPPYTTPSESVTDPPYTTPSDDSNLDDADDVEILFHAHEKGGAKKGVTHLI